MRILQFVSFAIMDSCITSNIIKLNNSLLEVCDRKTWIVFTLECADINDGQTCEGAHHSLMSMSIDDEPVLLRVYQLL
jgi:hypothetical protein